MVIKTTLRATTTGEWMINFSFASKGKTTLISSGIRISSKKNFKNGRIVGEPNAAYNNAKLLQELLDYQKAYDALPIAVKEAGLTTVIKAISQPSVKSYSFKDYAQTIIDDYENRGKGSALTKKNALAKFTFIFKDIPLTSITKGIIVSFMDKMRENGLSEASVGIYTREVRTIYNKALDDETLSLQDTRPFRGVKIPKGAGRQTALTVEQVKRIRDVDVAGKMQGVARDVFMAIFYIGGINMKDMLLLNHPADGRISYHRAKTAETKGEDVPISLHVQPELQEVIDRYKGENTLFDFGYKYSRYQDFTSLVNRELKKLAKKAGITENLTTYVARHSWATIADELGVDINVIEYVLGQSAKGRVVFQYMHRRNKAADEAIRKVLDALL